jgi:hypothetical protein
VSLCSVLFSATSTLKDNDFVKKEILFYNRQKRLPTKIEEVAAMAGGRKF